MSYELYVVVEGPGTSPDARSHWGILIAESGKDYGDLLHVKVLYEKDLIYQFEERQSPIQSTKSEGRWLVATLDYKQRNRAKQLIKKVTAPADGKKRCQDWVLDVFIELEAEDLIPSGSCDRCDAGIGKAAANLGSIFEEKWLK